MVTIFSGINFPILMVLTEKSQEFKLFRRGFHGVNRLNQGKIDFLATE